MGERAVTRMTELEYKNVKRYCGPKKVVLLRHPCVVQ